jgi:hypothetical protein
LAAVSQFGSQGADRTLALDGTVLDVDMALSPDGGELAIVEAGTADDRAPKPTLEQADARDLVGRIVEGPDSRLEFGPRAGDRFDQWEDLLPECRKLDLPRRPDEDLATTPFEQGDPVRQGRLRDVATLSRAAERPLSRRGSATPDGASSFIQSFYDYME